MTSKEKLCAAACCREIPLACTARCKSMRPEHARFRGNGYETEARITDSGRLDIKLQEDQTAVANFLESMASQKPDTSSRLFPAPDDLQFPVKLNIVMHVVGSRGDVQPFIVLGKALQQHGHRVRLATHLIFQDFVKGHGLEFFNIGGDPTELMSFMVQNPKLFPKMDTLFHGAIGRRRQEIRRIIGGCWRSCFEAGEGIDLLCDAPLTAPPFVADVIIANPPSFAHIHCAEKFGIPLHLMFTMPWSPTQAFPHPLANIHSFTTKPSVAKVASYAVTEMVIWQGLGDLQNEFRRFELGLEPLDAIRAPSLIHRLQIPFTYMWSPALLPKPDDWRSHIDVTGFNFLAAASDYEPPSDLLAFLESGPTPIYIGFGSIVVDDPDSLTDTILAAVQLTGRRALISQGWGGLGAESFQHPDIFLLGSCPHDWLFQHVSCVIHHGGAGTTAIGLAMGRPTAIVPFFGDQPFWGALVAVNKAGPWPIPFRELTPTRLAEAIHKCLEPATIAKAEQLSQSIRSEDGAKQGVASFHRQLKLSRIRCSLCPDQPAVWRVRKTKILLSPLAASVLVRGGHLEPHDVKLYHSKYYDTNTDPRGPFYASAQGIAGAVGNFITGIVSIPMHMVQGISQPKRSRFADGFGLPTCSERAAAIHAARDDSGEAIGVDHEISGTEEVGDNLKAQPSDGATSSISTSSSQDGPTMAKQSAASSLLSNSSYTGRRVMNWAIEIPSGLTLLLSQGFHDAPRWYHDRTVKDTPVAHDIRSGLKAAGKEFWQSWYDGISGLVTQPQSGWKQGGVADIAKGVGKGVGGVLLKPQAGLWGLIGYPLNGVSRSIEKSYGANRQDYIILSRIRQGDADSAAASAEEKTEILRRWRVLQLQASKGHSEKQPGSG
ncbi:hypothetical protein BJX76DRAFT_348307 [Aspergillus varians]